jgi:hypothetical protein
MRDKLIHEYFGIDLEIVWETVQHDLSALYAAVQEILQDKPRTPNPEPRNPNPEPRTLYRKPSQQSCV